MCDIFKVHTPVAKSGLAKSFVNLAKSQEKFFRDIFPWRLAENSDMLMLIAATDLKRLRQTSARACSAAPTDRTRICGWLTAIVDKKNTVYLSEFSCRSAVDKDPMFRGVAQRLFEELKAWCAGNGIRYIYLYPLNATVEAIYERWGLSKQIYTNSQTGQSKTTKHMFYRLSTLPTPENLTKMSRPTLDYDVIAEHLTRSQNALLRRIRDERPDVYLDITKTIEGLIAVCEEDPDVLDGEIASYLRGIQLKA
jgi:GNAT superfamily N-acetyltransferase